MEGEQLPGGEVCNGEDEDCDGEIDEELGEFSCGLGACRITIAACTKGVLGICIPLPPTTSVDGCNGVDDDCDGAVDEDCGDCVRVAPTGDDALAAAGDGSTPFRNLQPAIAFAALNAFDQVCVAAGSACGVTATYPGPATADLTMEDGVSVLGNYEATSWTRCANSTTTLAPATARGVYFPSTIASFTSLDGFTVDRAAIATTAGVTIEGGRNVLLSNLTIVNAPSVSTSYGVNLTNGGDATIVRSRITAGMGLDESIGVRVVGARITLEDNCASPSATHGRCDDSCNSGASIQGQRPRPSKVNLTENYAVVLDEAPYSRIERSAVCASSWLEHAGPHIVGVSVRGSAEGVVVRANQISAVSETSSGYVSGLSLADCGDAEPWIVDNHGLQAENLAYGGSSAGHINGVRSEGACHPRFDSNRIGNLVTGSRRSPLDAALHCGSAAGTASHCVLSQNQITGVTAPEEFRQGGAAGVFCEGGCTKIARNRIIGDRTQVGPTPCISHCLSESYALWVKGGGPFIDRNDVGLGCISMGSAVRLEDTFSRVQNNIVKGRQCRIVDNYYQGERAFWITKGAAGHEVDVHSNSITSALASALEEMCPINDTIFIDAQPQATPPPLGILRNNVIMPSFCAGTYTIRENDAYADPRIIEYNHMVLSHLGVYRDWESSDSYVTFDEMHALTDITARENGEPSDRPGTPVGAPLWDFNGNPRNDPPVVGHIETTE